MSAPPKHLDAEASDDATGAALTVTLVPGAERGQTPTLAVSGTVDLTTATRFSEAVRAATRHQKVILDLTAVQFGSGAVVDVLFEQRAGISAVLIHMESIVTQALKLAGFPVIRVR